MKKNNFPDKRKNLKIIFVCLFLASLIIRIYLLYIFTVAKSVESWEYDQIARNIVEARGYSLNYLGSEYKSFAPPLYPLLIAGIYYLFGIQTAPVVITQIILSIMTCIIIYCVAGRILPEKSAIIAFCLCLFHPGLIIYSVKKIHALNLDNFLFALTVFLVFRIKDNPRVKQFILGGFGFGITVLSRPSILAFLPPALLWLFFTLKKPLRIKAFNSFVLLLAMAIPIFPWVMRNYAIHKKFILTTTNDAEVFWRGNNENASGTSFSDSKIYILESDRRLHEKVKGLKEIEKRDAFMNEAVKFVKNNPKKFLKLYLKKICYFWGFSPASGLLYPQAYLSVYKVFYYTMLLLGLYGLVCLFAKGNPEISKEIVLLVLFLLSISLFQSLFYIEGRHRWAIEPFLLIFSANGITEVFNKAKKLKFMPYEK